MHSYISIGAISNYYQRTQLVAGPSRLILSCKPIRGAISLLVMNSRRNTTLFPYLHSNEGRITKKKKKKSYQAISQPLYPHTPLMENRPRGEITSAFIPLIGQ